MAGLTPIVTVRNRGGLSYRHSDSEVGVVYLIPIVTVR